MSGFAGISTVQTLDGAVKFLQDVAHGELVRSAVGFEPVIGSKIISKK
jgi:hypothetical protein